MDDEDLDEIFKRKGSKDKQLDAFKLNQNKNNNWDTNCDNNPDEFEIENILPKHKFENKIK